MKRIAMLGGGSGNRDITMALCRSGHDVTRIVPAWDSGGSSRALRLAFGMVAIGDTRQALMTLAHGEGRVGSVVRFFNARLSEAASPADLRAELAFYADGRHPLLGTMENGIRRAILEYLEELRGRIDDSFDLRRGSIGNFVLVGAYLAHGRDINTAIRMFRKLCAIDGNVWPSTTCGGVELHAELRDGTPLRGQDRITALDATQTRIGIRRVRLSAGDDGSVPAPNPEALAAIARADIILFGPGSFFTSTLPHLAVTGIADAVESTRRGVPKVLIGNILECAESTGRSLAEERQAFDELAGRGLLTHVIANRGFVPFERVAKGFHYLSEGAPWPPAGAPPRLVADDFEDPWDRGRHDADKLVATLARL